MNSSPQPPDGNQKLADQQDVAILVGALAHEIKNPLSTISLNMELLAEDFSDEESPRDRRTLAKIAIVQRECQRLQNLLNDFTNFANVRQLRLEPADLNDIVRSVLEFFRPKAEQAHIEIFPYLQSDLPTVLLDREAIHAALLNLILNAQQAMPGGGQLAISTQATSRGVALHLIDTGCGMDDKTLGQIFQPFFSTKRGGTGLGLPTTRKVIEAHGGLILVQSELGRGTQFTIELPVPARLPVAEPITPIPVPGPVAGKVERRE